MIEALPPWLARWAPGCALALLLAGMPAPERSLDTADAAVGLDALASILGRDVPLCTHAAAVADGKAGDAPVWPVSYEPCPGCAGIGGKSAPSLLLLPAGQLPAELFPSRSAVTASNPAAPLPGMLPVVDPSNIYSETKTSDVRPDIAGAPQLVYVPNRVSNTVDVVDPATRKIINHFPVGINPQHVVPSWDMKTLWVVNDAENSYRGSVTPVDPFTGKPGATIPVDDPYNMYFSPDGKSAIVVAEARQRLDFRDPHTMALQFSIDVPQCIGINHADFSIDGKFAIFTCEFGGSLAKIDLIKHEVLGILKLSKGGMPQDIRSSPDGKIFYVADMHADGVFMIDADAFKEVGLIATGVGTHGLYPSRDGKKLYVSNRGTHNVLGRRHGQGSVSVVDFVTHKVEYTWAIPGGGSPDMGNVSADGKHLWLSGRFDDVIYDIDTQTGAVAFIPVGREPHGLTIWPQPGRYSLGHTGVMR